MLVLAAQTVEHLIHRWVAKVDLVPEILVPELLKPPRWTHLQSPVVAHMVTSSQSILQTGVDCISIVDMVAVYKCGNYGNGSFAETAFEPYYDDQNDLSLQVLRVPRPVLMNYHAPSGSTTMTSYWPDSLHIVDYIQRQRFGYSIKCSLFGRRLLKKLKSCPTMYGH